MVFDENVYLLFQSNAIIHLRTRPKNEYVTLNETFFKILQGIEQGKNEADIVATLCQEYSISEADCRKEVAEAIGQLLEKGYISKIDE